MTIAELIERLQAFRPETEVVVNGYESGFDPIVSIEVRRVKEVPGSWYELLRHELYQEPYDDDPDQGRVVLYLKRGGNK